MRELKTTETYLVEDSLARHIGFWMLISPLITILLAMITAPLWFPIVMDGMLRHLWVGIPAYLFFGTAVYLYSRE